MKHRHPMIDVRRRELCVLAGALGLTAMGLARAAGSMMGSSQAGEHDHLHHALPDGLKRSAADYRVPAVVLVRQDGTRAQFPQEIDGGQPVILDFMYTSCTAICPVTSQTFHQVQDQLGPDLEKVRMVSISIDPEYDTPARLTEFAKKFGASRQWQHYTGTVQSSIAMQRAFDAFRGDKMNHIPVTFLRAAPGKPWVRMEGLATAAELVEEYRHLALND